MIAMWIELHVGIILQPRRKDKGQAPESRLVPTSVSPPPHLQERDLRLPKGGAIQEGVNPSCILGIALLWIYLVSRKVVAVLYHSHVVAPGLEPVTIALHKRKGTLHALETVNLENCF